ncbi:MAG TPA: SCO family protein [Phenylobacterium sp.]|jgi:protein SCO1/2|uniref:SCO family protein n=1 Tax=Phenylobacterium sp. TaxID=1871053 RepID=UPI002D246E96|nr:SCO family protein [Phenylobacterium sp.]HZZ70310.1 SCO family protein [Phenylobacterium sp.]
MVLLAALAGLALGGHARAQAAFDPARLASVSAPPFARAPMDLAFRDQHGATVTLRQLAAGKPLVIAPVQHECRNLCGLTLEALRRSLSGLPLRPGADFTLVALGIDPRETPADAARSAQRLGGAASPGVEALVGSPAADARLTGALGYRYSWMAATGQYAHMAAVAVLTSDGRLVRWLPGLGIKPAELQAALNEAQRGETPGLADQIRLLCFHFDPATGRYSLAIWRVLRWMAAGAATVVLGGVALAFWRERRMGAVR